MNVSPVLHLEENGVHTIAFHHNQQGQANTDLVLAYFAQEFLPSTAGVRRLVIDLSGVVSLNSASLGPLVQKLREIQDLEGQLALAGVTSPALKEIFALTRFERFSRSTRPAPRQLPPSAAPARKPPPSNGGRSA